MMKPTAAGVFWVTWIILEIMVAITIGTLVHLTNLRVEGDSGAHAVDVEHSWVEDNTVQHVIVVGKRGKP